MNLNLSRRLSDAFAKDCLPRTREYTVHDAILKGFGLRVQPGGSKAWIIRLTNGGEPKRITIGDCRVLGVEAARKRAYAILARGEIPPSRPKRAGRLFSTFEKEYKQRRKDFWSTSTLRTYESYMRSTILPTFGDQPLEAIGHTEVARWFHDYSATAPGGANHARDNLRAVFNCARDWGMLTDDHVNPCRGIPRNRRSARGRVLNHDAIARLGAALRDAAARYPSAADAIQLILLTGCRPGEIIGLKWEEVESDRLSLGTSKTGPRRVFLGDAAQDLLRTRKANLKFRSRYVFPSSRRANRPIYDLRYQWLRIRSSAGLESDVRLHDLRHTFASHALMDGETMVVTGRLLGHRQLATTARYSHLQDKFLLGAAERISRQILLWTSTP